MNKLLKAIAPLVLVFFFSVAIVGPGWGEEGKTLTNEQLKINQAKYDAEKKDPNTAAVLSYFVPSLGHYYAGDWLRGVKFLLIDAAVIGLAISASDQASLNRTDPSGAGSFIQSLGIVLLAGAALTISHVWCAIDAIDTINNFNQQLKKKYGMSLGINIDSLDLRYSFNF